MLNRFGSVSGSTSGRLPEGGLWRRAEIQLATRLGSFPGDRVLVMAPPGHDPAASLAARLPRVRFLQLGGAGPFAWSGPGPERVRSAPGAWPVQEESVDAVVLAFAVPLLDAAAHDRLVGDAARVLYPFGKWFELVALEGPGDPRLVEAERHLKAAGFEKVRSARLALGRMGGTLFLVTGRWPGRDDDASELE